MVAYSDTSILFNGTTQYADAGNVLGFERDASFSVMFWAKWTSAASMPVVDKRGAATTYTGWGVYAGTSGRPLLWLSNDSGGGDQLGVEIATTDYSDDTWRQFVVTYNGTSAASGVTWYVNGFTVAMNTTADALTASILNAVALRVASRVGNPTYFAGNVDEIAIYDKKLSQAEVSWLWYGGNTRDLEGAGAPSNLVTWWRMGENGTPPNVPDERPAGNDLTLVNNPTIEADAPPGTLTEFLYVPPDAFADATLFVRSFVGGDTTPPTIGNFDPPVGTPLARNDFVSFDVTDLSGLLRAELFVTLGDDVFVVHDGERFRGRFTNFSTRSTIANGFRYRTKPNGGWTVAPVFEVHATDTDGNEAS